VGFKEYASNSQVLHEIQNENGLKSKEPSCSDHKKFRT